MFKCGLEYVNTSWRLSCRARVGCLAVRIMCCQLCPMGWERERDTAMAVWQQGCGSRSLCVPSLSEPKRGRRKEGTRRGEKEWRDPIITWSPRCWMSVRWRDCKSPLLNVTGGGAQTAAVFALLAENKVVSKLLDRCSPPDAGVKSGGSQSEGNIWKEKMCIACNFGIVVWVCF